MSVWLNSLVPSNTSIPHHKVLNRFLGAAALSSAPPRRGIGPLGTVPTSLPSSSSSTTASLGLDQFSVFSIFSGGGNETEYRNDLGMVDNYLISGDDGSDQSIEDDDSFILFNNGLATTSDLASSLGPSSPSASLDSTTEFYLGNEDLPEGIGEEIGLLDFWLLFDEKNLRHNFGWTVTLIIAYLLILLIGIIGNCMVILVVLLRPQMRTVTNMFIMNLAVADLFVIVFCVPATLLANVLVPWILGKFMCKGVAYVQGVSVCASAYSLAAISLDRCKAIYRPMERPKGLSKSQALATICLIWILALLMTLPWAVVFDVVKSDKDGLLYCLEVWRNEEHGKVYFLVANLICCYSLPLVLISLSNVVIWCHVSRRKVPQDSASIGNIKRMHRKTRHGVRKMLGIVTLAFLISWLPLYVLVTRVKFSSQENIGESEANLLSIMLPFAQWLGSWNSSINPVLYAFLNSKFRESFRSLLPSWMPCSRSKHGLMMNGMATNGTIVGTTGTPSHTTVYTARSSGRSLRSGGSSIVRSGGSSIVSSSARRGNVSRRSCHQSQRQLQRHRSVTVNQIKAPSLDMATTAGGTITDL